MFFIVLEMDQIAGALVGVLDCFSCYFDAGGHLVQEKDQFSALLVLSGM